MGSIQLRVVLHSRDPLARAGLAALLGSLEGVVVVDLVDDLADVSGGADVVISELRWGEPLDIPPSGIPRVLALAEDQVQARQARSAGATGVLRRDSGEAEIAAAISAVAVGLPVFSEDLVPPDSDPIVDVGGAGPEALTAREAEILELVATGLANKAIAARLAIRESTVKFHVNAILAKLGAQSRTEAVARALRSGLIRF